MANQPKLDNSCIHNLKRRCLQLALACTCLMPSILQAAESRELLDMSLEELLQVTVTGSHIKRPHESNTKSIRIIDRKTIQNSGAISTEILLQRLAFSAGYAGNQTNAYWAVNGNGSTHVNLRGLGINRTLILLNGRRLANGGIGANATVDLNNISLATIERIEILKDGASAIYGADAVAGVVNIITRSDLVGVEASLRTGESFQGDGNNRSADVSWGATMNAEHGCSTLATRPITKSTWRIVRPVGLANLTANLSALIVATPLVVAHYWPTVGALISTKP